MKSLKWNKNLKFNFSSSILVEYTDQIRNEISKNILPIMNNLKYKKINYTNFIYFRKIMDDKMARIIDFPNRIANLTKVVSD